MADNLNILDFVSGENSVRNIIAETLPLPTLTALSASGVSLRPALVTSTGVHTTGQTQVEVRRASDSVVVHSSLGTDGVLHNVAEELPWNTACQFRARHKFGSVWGPWSPWSGNFTTRWRPNVTDISSLVLFLRPDELVSGALSTWSDFSGGNHHATQTTGANQPTVSLNQLNGYPTVQWDGSNDKMATDLTGELDATFTIIAVVRINTALASQDRGRILASSGGGLGFGISGPTNDRKLRLVHTNVAWMNPSTSAVPVDTWTIVGATWDAAADEAVYYINGTGDGIITYAGTPGAGANPIRIGNEGNLDQYSSALQFAEILAFSSVVSGANRHKVEGYLAWKYGLAGSLPGGHTYKSVAP